MEEARIIAANAPGLGDPWDLTPAVWGETLARIYEDRAMASENKDAQMSARMERMKREARRKRWLKHSEKPT